MLASNRCTGSRTIWCATHASVHAFNCVSAWPLRPRRPGADASGHVCTTASRTNNASTAAALLRLPRAVGAPLGATITSLIQRVVRTGSLDALETGEGRE